MEAVLLGLAIGLLAGFLSGLFGIGGAIVIIPALVLLGFPQREAAGTSLAALLMPVGILGVLEYARRHEVRVGWAVGLALGLLFGAYVGAVLAGKLSNPLLQRLFGLVLLAVSIRFVFFPR